MHYDRIVSKWKRDRRREKMDEAKQKERKKRASERHTNTQQWAPVSGLTLHLHPCRVYAYSINHVILILFNLMILLFFTVRSSLAFFRFLWRFFLFSFSFLNSHFTRLWFGSLYVTLLLLSDASFEFMLISVCYHCTHYLKGSSCSTIRSSLFGLLFFSFGLVFFLLIILLLLLSCCTECVRVCVRLWWCGTLVHDARQCTVCTLYAVRELDRKIKIHLIVIIYKQIHSR